VSDVKDDVNKLVRDYYGDELRKKFRSLVARREKKAFLVGYWAPGWGNTPEKAWKEYQRQQRKGRKK